MTFDHLSDGEFEELTYDLLRDLGFVNLSWRRGTGRAGATADQGRDIVGTEIRKDVDGSVHNEIWFVQCKRYERGVPPEALQGALAWALAERPATLVFVVSNFLSNPAKNFLSDYQKNNTPPFKIKVWERKDLENLIAGKTRIAAKFKLTLEEEFLRADPRHLRYVCGVHLNSYDDLFRLLEQLDPKDRDDLFSFAYYSVIHPKFRASNNENETMADRMIGDVKYESFKSKCRSLAQTIDETFMVQAIMSWTVAWAWNRADPVHGAEVKKRHESGIEYFSLLQKNATDEKECAQFGQMVEFMRRGLANMPAQDERSRILYGRLCEVILQKLPLEEAATRKLPYPGQGRDD